MYAARMQPDEIAAMWLTDAELTDYPRDSTATTNPGLANAPDGERRRRMLYTVLPPAPKRRHDQTGGPEQPPPRRRTGTTNNE